MHRKLSLKYIKLLLIYSKLPLMYSRLTCESLTHLGIYRSFSEILSCPTFRQNSFNHTPKIYSDKYLFVYREDIRLPCQEQLTIPLNPVLEIRARLFGG